MLHPVLQLGHTLFAVRSHHTRCLYKKSLLHSAPTGHKSTTLPANLLSHAVPGKMSISEWLPRSITVSSAVPLISRVNRTQRVHMMQRSVNSVICSPMYVLSGGCSFGSWSRLYPRPYLKL